MSTETIARLHIVLDDIAPAIWRRVDVPVTASLKMVHDIVQAAMGWEDSASARQRPAARAITRMGRNAGTAPWSQRSADRARPGQSTPKLNGRLVSAKSVE